MPNRLHRVGRSGVLVGGVGHSSRECRGVLLHLRERDVRGVEGVRRGEEERTDLAQGGRAGAGEPGQPGQSPGGVQTELS